MSNEINRLVNEFYDIDKAIDDFACSMRRKMRQKAIDGYAGWNDPNNIELIMRGVRDHFHRLESDPYQDIDCANFLMMHYFWRKNHDAKKLEDASNHNTKQQPLR